MNTKQYQADYYKKNKSKHDAETKSWQQRNKKKVSAYQKRYRLEQPERYLLTSSKSRAKYKGIEFSLTLEDIIIPKVCPYFEIELVPSEGKLADNSPSLDRIDNSKGYVKDNVEVISYLANRVKNNLTREQLLLFANNILKRIK